METIRRILTIGIWIAFVVLDAIGRYLVMKVARQNSQTTPRENPIVMSISWNDVDQAIAIDSTDTRRRTEDFTSKQIDKWITELI